MGVRFPLEALSDTIRAMREIMAKAPHLFQELSESEINLLLENQDTHQAWMVVWHLITQSLDRASRQATTETIYTLLDTIKNGPTHGQALRTELRDSSKQYFLEFLHRPTMLDTQEMLPVSLDSELDPDALSDEEEEYYSAHGAITDEQYLQGIIDTLSWFDIFGSELPAEPGAQAFFLSQYRVVLEEMKAIFYEDELQHIEDAPGEEPLFKLIEWLGEIPVREIFDHLDAPDISASDRDQLITSLFYLYGYKTVGATEKRPTYLFEFSKMGHALKVLHNRDHGAPLLDETIMQAARRLLQSINQS